MTDSPQTQSVRPPKDTSGLVLAGAPSAPAILCPDDAAIWLRVLMRADKGLTPTLNFLWWHRADCCDFDIMQRLGQIKALSGAAGRSVAANILRATVALGLDPGTAFTPWSRAHRSRRAGLNRRERERRDRGES